MPILNKRLDAVLEDFILTNDSLRKVSGLLLEEFEKGLTADTNASVKMFPTFVRDVPDGSENGTFLALDLGGSLFRVLRIELQGELCDMTNKIYEIPQAIMTGPGDDLFDHIAKCLENYVRFTNLQDRMLPLGFTFSFPCIQKSLTSAVLVSWTKGFTCPGVVGEDVVQSLRSAINRRGTPNLDIKAVINDTTGTLMSCAYKNKGCRIGLIVGTGCNACYMETLENVITWTGDLEEPDQVVVNTELGAFGDNGCLELMRTMFDKQTDENSLNVGQQLFEKMISGMYMGEIVRAIVSKLTNEKVIFMGNLSHEFGTPFKFKSKYVSEVENDCQDDMKETTRVLQKMGVKDVSRDDCEILKRICSCVSTRSAYLVSAAVATILNKMKRPHTVVGVDGSLYRYHPHFKNLMQKKTNELTDPNYKFEFMLSEDGSGIGAALVAAVASRIGK